MECDQLKSAVIQWFGQEFDCRAGTDGFLTATLPLLKPNGDAIEIGLEPLRDGYWKLSDLGETHSTLFLAGVELDDEYVRSEEFRQMLSAHRISDLHNELILETSSDDLVERIFEFVHAMQSILALQFTLRPRPIRRDFPSVVAKFLAENNASFEIPPQPIEGLSGSWKFNFILNHVRRETLVKAITATSKPQALRSAEQAVFEIRRY